MWYLILFSVALVRIRGEDPPHAPHSLLPPGKCVPTAVEVGPCHTCVCDNNGVFVCRYQECNTGKLNEATQQGKVSVHDYVDECTPHMLYKDGILWCSCTEKKRWKSESCRQNFYHTRNKVPLRDTQISIDAISCEKNSYYAVDCNICLCKTGILDQSSCTNRTCLEGSKVDDCKFGQVLRIDGELCTCSELGFYVDKLCIRVKGVNTKLEPKDLAVLTHEEKGLKEDKRTFLDKHLKCEPNSIFNVDCNKCWCSEDGKDMKCTAKLCSPDILKQTMFQGKSEARSSLPILESLTSACTPGLYYRYQCKTCFCNKDGSIRCASMICLDVEDNSYTDSPNIPEGEKCVKGQTYKKDCGTCTCNENNRMMCTKTACLSPEDLKKLHKIEKEHSKEKEKNRETDQKSIREGEKKQTIKKLKINSKTSNKKVRFNKPDFKSAGDTKKTIETNKIQAENDVEMRANDDELEESKIAALQLGLLGEDEVEEDTEEEDEDVVKYDDKPVKLTDATGRFPELNPKTKCTPGKIYSKGCQRCFCCDKKKPRCTNKPCKDISKSVLVPADTSPAISGIEFARLESLPHEAAKCTPGKSYKVKCNRCLCLANGNLLCDNKLCASIAEINTNTAWKHTGKPCKSNNDAQPGDCITCTCENKEFKCKPRPKCIPREFNSASVLKSVKHLEINSSEECVPHMLYKQACNECYCQEDHTLRCTRKGCLSYTQVKKLNQLRQKLLNEGL